MYAAVSGLKAHMNALNVIGNNVSNVNTTAYKATRYTFNEALYTTQRSGSDGTNISGGRNPAQVGFGASIGTIDIDMSTKNYTPTGQLLDTMIDGDGFFFVGDKEVGTGATAVEVGDSTTLKGMNLTRLGNFNIDPNGYLVDGNGSVVWGFLEQETYGPARDEDGKLPEFTMPTEADATTVTIGSGDDAVEYELFNVNGTKKVLTQLTEEDVEILKKNGVELHNVKTKNVKEQIDPSDASKGTKNVAYVVSATKTISEAMTSIRIPTVVETINSNGDTVKTVNWPSYTAEKEEIVDSTKNPGDEGYIVQEAAPAKFEDGAGSRLQPDSVTIDEKSGALRVMTSDGQLYTVGYLAIAKVTNPNGVTHVDGRYYQAQDGAGRLRVTSVKGSVSGVESAGDTKLITGGLESSGTDLATEITNMITVQRGYQANTRIVTVTDSMLEELVNMKR
jgi:flagellar hook protein FlgE